MTAEEMWNLSGISGNYEAWAFGGDADYLAGLVRQGIKTATCSALVFYEEDGERIPQTGDYSVVLDSAGAAVCIIQTEEVTICAFRDISAEHAWKEGEGDRSLAYWRRVHKEFFTEELRPSGRTFQEDMKLVCETFRVVFPRESSSAQSPDR